MLPATRWSHSPPPAWKGGQGPQSSIVRSSDAYAADDVQSCLVRTGKKNGHQNYRSHLRRIGFFYGVVPALETKKMV